MGTVTGDRLKNLSPNHPSINTANIVYKSQPLATLNTSKVFPILRHDITNKNHKNNKFKIYHQNIPGLHGKMNELMLSLITNTHHLICLTEHHLKNCEIIATPISNYKLGANYCRKSLKSGGVCIYVHDALQFKNIDLQRHCKEQEIEISALKLKINKKNVIIFCIYRAAPGEFDNFLNKLNSLHTYNTEYIICGYININYPGNNNKQNQLNYMLRTYNMISTVHFPTRISHNSATLIDNIFVDNRRHYNIKPCINGVSALDAQLITLNNLSLPLTNTQPTHIRNINKNATAEFQLQLSWEQWDNIFGNNNVNDRFNNLLSY
jgi:exonuclease III